MSDSFDSQILALETGLTHLFDPQYLQEVASDNVHTHYHNTFYNIKILHDFQNTLSFEENIEKNTNKYQRRLNRLHARIAKARSILIVHSETGNVEIDEDFLKQQYIRIKKIFPKEKNIDLLVINFRDDTKESVNHKVDNNISKVIVPVDDLGNYKSLKAAGKPYLQNYDVPFSVKLLHFVRFIAMRLRKPILKIAASLPMPKKYKQKIRTAYKDRYQA